MAAAISHGSSGGMADVGPHLVMAEPGTQLVPGPEVVPDLRERRRPLASREALQRFDRPGVGLVRAVSHDTADVVVTLSRTC